jgi:transposase-like protein
VEILVIRIDGQKFGAHHTLSAVGVDREGRKRILGIEGGRDRNAAAVKRLLTETHFRKIDGHRDLWALATILGRQPQTLTSQDAVA